MKKWTYLSPYHVHQVIDFIRLPSVGACQVIDLCKRLTSSKPASSRHGRNKAGYAKIRTKLDCKDDLLKTQSQ